jgi:hypothetical protein
MNLTNETKIRFCNAYNAMEHHIQVCSKCLTYLNENEGDLCGVGKDIIRLELVIGPPPINAPS